MGPFGELYERLPALVDVPAGLPLVITLTGFTDAGGAASQMHEYFRDEVQPEPLVVFNNDILLDYRARRPRRGARALRAVREPARRTAPGDVARGLAKGHRGRCRQLLEDR